MHTELWKHDLFAARLGIVHDGIETGTKRAPDLLWVAALIPVVEIGSDEVDERSTRIPVSDRSAIRGVHREAPGRHGQHPVDIDVLSLQHRVDLAPRVLEVGRAAPRVGLRLRLMVQRQPHIAVDRFQLACEAQHVVVQGRAGLSVRDTAPGDDLTVLSLWLDRHQDSAATVDNPVVVAVVDYRVPPFEHPNEWQRCTELTFESLDRLDLGLAVSRRRCRTEDDAVVGLGGRRSNRYNCASEAESEGDRDATDAVTSTPLRGDEESI